MKFQNLFSLLAYLLKPNVGPLLSVLFSISSPVISQITTPMHWVKNMGGQYWEMGNTVAVDSLGNVYTAGHFSGNNVDFDPGPGIFQLQSTGSEDIFICKLDAFGNFQWAKSMAGTPNGHSSATSLVIDPAGYVYMTGYFENTVDFDTGPGTYTLSVAQYNRETFICKLDMLGNMIWTKDMDGTAWSYAHDITLDSFGNVYTTGILYGTVDFDPGPGTYTLMSAPSAYTSLFISKLNSAGNFVWAKSVSGGSASDCFGNGVTIDRFGNVYTTGCFYGTADFNPGTGTSFFSSTTSTSYDIFVLKLDMAGNYVWTKIMGGNGIDNGNAITTDTLGNILITGNYNSAADFDPGSGSTVLIPVAMEDNYICKLDATGNLVWARNIGGTDSDYSNSITTDPSGNVYTGGTFRDIVDFDPGPGVHTMGSFAWNNIFILKLDAQGQYVWSKVTGGTGNGFYCGDFALSKAGNIYAAGSAFGTYVDFQPPAATHTINSNVINGGNWDLYVMKLIPCDAPDQTFSVTGSSSVCAGSPATLTASGVNTYTWNTGATTSSITFTAVSPYSYSVSGTSTFGCVSSITGSINVIPLPVISVNSGSICSGQTFSIIPSGAFTYTYSGGSALVTPTSSSSYTVSGTNLQGCLSATPGISYVTVSALPILTLTQSSSLVCTGITVTLTAAGADSYTWSNNPPGNSVVITPTITTTYTVTGLDLNGCQTTGSITQNVENCTGMQEHVFSSSYEIYPNPASDALYLRSLKKEDILVRVISVSGKILLEQALKGETAVKISLVEFENGIYFILAGEKAQKFIKQ